MESSCIPGIEQYGSIAYYSHLIPVFISLVLAVSVLFKSRYSFLSKIFFLFTSFFCVWLVFDVLAWTSKDYNIVTFVWSSLDYANILFYLAGAYFFAVLVKGEDVPLWQKLMFLAFSLPAWYLTVTNSSITSFNQTVCEASNNEWLTQYKIVVEFLVVGYILFYSFFKYKALNSARRKQMLLVATGLILFFATFSITEYISSQTGIYEINLYSLFILPVFLGIIIYSIVGLNIFEVKMMGTQVMVYVLLIMVGSQFFFLENSTDKLLTTITFLISLFFAYVLVQSSRREVQARKHVEELVFQLEDANEKLKGLDKMKTEFLSLASHQLRSPLTAIKGYASMLLEGSYGKVPDDQRVAIDRVFQSSNNLTQIVEDLLDVTKIEQGGMQYLFDDLDLVKIARSITDEYQMAAKNKGLTLVYEGDTDPAIVSADSVKMRQVLINYLDNALKYTLKGTVTVSVHANRETKKVVYAVKDSGMGIAPEIMQTLFKKFERGEGGKVNAGGSGLGLYLAKEIVAGHKGRTWAESEGRDKGSTFLVELDLK